MSTSEKVTKFDNLIRSLNKIMFGSENEDVTLDGISKPTWSKWLKLKSSVIDSKADKSYVDAALGSFQMGSSKFYPTLAQANADIANIMPKVQSDSVRDPVTVGESDNGGIWYKENYNSTSLTKSQYDPKVQAKNYTDSELESINKPSLVNLANDAEYVDMSEEFALNNVPLALFDSLKNVVYVLQNGILKFSVPIDISVLKINGKDLGVFSKEGIDLINHSISSYYIENNIYPTDEFALNTPPVYAILDSDKNIIFNVNDYYQALNNIKTLKLNVSSLLESQDKVDALINDTATLINADAIPFVDNNKAKIYQTTTSSEVTIDLNASGLSNPRMLDSNTFLFESTDSEVSTYAVDRSTLKAQPLRPRPKIVGWGHSFMQANTFLNYIEEFSGLETYNFGAAGTTSVGIAARQGGKKLKFTPVGNVIPAEISTIQITPFVERFIVYESIPIKVNYCGIDGKISLSNNTLYFTRDVAGSVIAVPTSQEVTVYPYTTSSTPSHSAGELYYKNDECINLFWLGRNNISSTETILSNAKSVIDYLKTKVKRFVILPDFPTLQETTGTSGNTSVMNLNAQLKALYPENYCEIDGVDLLKNFQNHLNPASSADVDSVAAGSVPPSLVSDNLHPTETLKSGALHIGTEVNAQFVYQFLVEKGWV